MTDQSPQPTFLGNPIELCIVTRSYQRTIRSLAGLGIGPWRIYTCSPDNTTAQTFQGRPSSFTIKFCFASLPPSNITYEVIQPVSGPNIFQSFLDEKGEGLHHVAYDCNNIPMEDRRKGFAERGWQCTQSGTWCVGGMNSFAFFEKSGAETCFETIVFEEGWDWPEPEEWYPPQTKKEGEEQRVADSSSMTDGK
ncbi:MAG: hypothetical protein Q9167_001183 [Letrouitia subvulpina]